MLLALTTTPPEAPAVAAEAAAVEDEADADEVSALPAMPALASAPAAPAASGGGKRRFSVALQPGDDMSQFLQEIAADLSSWQPGMHARHDAAEADAEGVQTLTVVCPDDVSPGDALSIQTEDGDELEIIVPEGVEAGEEFEVQFAG